MRGIKQWKKEVSSAVQKAHRLSFHPSALKTGTPVLPFIFGVIVNYKMMRSMKLQVRTGLEEMMGQEALVIYDIDPEGKVRFKDEILAAKTKGERLEQGDKAKIVGSRGLVLVVANTGEKSSAIEERLSN